MKGCGRAASAGRRSRSRRRSSATSCCREVRTASPPSCCGTFAPAVDPTSGFRDLGSPAPGANVIGPADGIMDVGTAFFVPEGWRRGNQFNVRTDYELRPGKDRLYGNFYRTNSYAMTGGIRPAFDRPTPNTTHFGNINHTHTFSSSKLNEFRAGVMRLVGLPDVPEHLEIPGINITGATGFGQSELSERVVADELGLQEHLHARQVDPRAEDGRRAAPDVRLGPEHGQLHPRLPVFQPLELCRRRSAAGDTVCRSAIRRAGHGLLRADADGMGRLHRRCLEGHVESDHQHGPAVRELRHVQGQRRHAAEPGARPRLDGRRAARVGARRPRGRVLPGRQQQFRAAARVRVGSQGRRQDGGARRLRAVVRPPHEPAGRELPEQSSAARDGGPRPVLRHAVHLQPR